jgi:hypothetical protein
VDSFAADGMGAVLTIDQRPGAIGEVERGQGWHRDCWLSLAAMMAEITDALEQSRRGLSAVVSLTAPICSLFGRQQPS